nr:hypothetical protein GOBAR_DD23592 [Ipomoea trifida]
MKIWDPSCFGLAFLDLPEINPNRAVPERIILRRAAVFLVGGAEAANQGVEAAPCLPERARAGGRGIGLPEEHATVQVNLSFPELVEVAEEFQDVVAVTVG